VADEVNALRAAAAGTWPALIARRTSIQTVTNSSALVNDNDLVLALAASAVYLIDAGLFFDGVANAHLKVAWAVPNAGQMTWSLSGENVGSNNAYTAVALETPNALAVRIPSSSIYHAEARGVVVTIDAGNLNLQWAQQVATSGDTRMRPRSWLRAQRIA
jgi:hypothetical protein